MPKRRLIAVLLSFSLIFSLGAGISLPASAEPDQKIEISSAEELMEIVFGDLSADYIQTADIDLSGKAFSPIGTIAEPFTGTYDGNGYKISGMEINSDKSCQGLFGVNNGTIRNVTLTEDCYVYGTSYVGGIAGRNNGVIEDCISDATAGQYYEEQEEAKTYKLLSQNLCQWGDNDLAASSNYVDSITNSRRPSMLQRILNANPDLLCFQEVSFSDYTKHGKKITAWDTYLRNNLTDYTIYGTYRSNSDTEGVTVGWKTEQFEQVDQGMFWLSPNPDAPRAQQYAAWDAGCVRATTWVLLKDKTTGQHLAIYCTHYDHAGKKAQVEGAKVITSKMADKKAELLAEYPDTMFIMTGDLNVEPTTESYATTNAGLDNWLDDAREACNKGAAIADLTYGNDINSVTDSDGIIDYIFTDSSTIEVSEFKVLTDYYYDKRPSDHHGIYAEFHQLQKLGIGAVAGSNGGTVQRVIVRGGYDNTDANGVGHVVGSNTGHVNMVYAFEDEGAIGAGRSGEISELPNQPEIGVVVALNKEAEHGAFTIIDEEYVVVGDKDVEIPVCLVVNGEDRVVYPGETYTLEELGFEPDAIIFFNGELLEEDFIVISKNGGEIHSLMPVSSVESAVVMGDYCISSMEEWMYLYEHQSFFANQAITIHLLCDLDFSDALAASFTHLADPAFGFNGHGNTIKNWGKKTAPVDEPGFFVVEEGRGGMPFITNLRFENCHLWNHGDNVAAFVYAVHHSNVGMEGLIPEVTLSNIKIDGCSLGSDYETCGFILSRYGSVGEYVNVYLKGCEVRNSVLDSNGKDHMGFLIGKIRSNGSKMQAKFFMEDCIVEGNEMKNASGSSGLAFGTIEGTSIDAYLHNVAILNNTVSGGDKFGLLGRMDQGGVVCKGVMIGGNTLSQSTKYVIAKHNGTPVNVTFEDVYCDVANLTAVVESKSASLSGTTGSVASGEAGYALNKRTETEGTWWTKTEDGYDLITDESKRIFKVAFRGAGEMACYVNGGEIFTLDGEEEYELIEGQATIEDNQFVVNMDLVFAKEIKLTDINAPVTSGEYDINSLEEFIYLYEHKAYFQNRSIVIHLRCDLDFSDERMADFHGFKDPYFSFDGHGYTIKNWGTSQNPASAKALFYAENGAGGLHYIKNINLQNCYLKDYYLTENVRGNNAILYTAFHGNAGLSGLPDALTISNVSIRNCAVETPYEASAVLLGRYAPESGNHTVTIQNVRIEGTTLDACEQDHKGLLVGKPRSNNKGGRATFNISDCYLYDNIILNAGDKNVGFAFGTAEVSSVTMNMTNIGLIGNTISRSGDAAIVGYSDGGQVNLQNVLIADNDVTSDSSYLIANKSGVGAISLTNVCSDETGLTKTVEGGNQTHNVNAAKMASGEYNYLVNSALQAPSFWWGMTNGLPAPADANRTAKITVRNAENAVMDTFYADGGESFTFPYEGMDYQLLSTNGASITGAVLTMPEGGKDVAVRAIESICEHDYDEENIQPYGDHQHKIPCSNGCGVDLIEDCVYGDWSHGEEAGASCHVRTCRCTREDREECDEEKISHLEGTKTHAISCSVCSHQHRVEACNLEAEGTGTLAIGQRGDVPAHCNKCGDETQTIEIVAGDMNEDGAVTISDVVLLLRWLDNAVGETSISVGAANVYTEDGVTENNGLTTADGIAILRYLLNR